MSDALVVEFGGARRCLSSAVLGGGLREATDWLNLQVGHGYARLDPDLHLAEEARARGLDPGTVIGMLTAANIRAVQARARGLANAHANVGISQPLAAAGRRPRRVAPVGTINVLVVVDAALCDAALAAALQTATEAKAQALADAGIRAANHDGPATGTATDSICVAALPGAREPFAGPVTPVGAAIASTVHATVLAGVRAPPGRRARGGRAVRRVRAPRGSRREEAAP
jgi:adenosylcobinamide hydrolase